jgi:hypothetical protein
MGSNQSSSQKKVTDVLMQSSMKYINSNRLTAFTNQKNVNSFEWDVGGDWNCSLDMTQKIEAKQDSKVVAKATSLADFKNDLKSVISDTLSQNNSSVNGFLSTTFGNQSSSSDIESKFHTIIDQQVTNENWTEVNNAIDNLNNGKIVIKGNYNCPNGPSTIIQDISTNQIASIYTDIITQALMSNTQVSEAASKMDTTNTVQNQGFSLAGILGFGFDPKTLLIIGIVIIVVAFITVFGMKKSAPQSPQYPMGMPSMGQMSMPQMAMPQMPQMSMGQMPMAQTPASMQPMSMAR